MAVVHREHPMATAAPDKRTAPARHSFQWSDDDRVYIDRLVDKGFEHQRAAIQQGNIRVFKEVEELLVGILMIADLFKAYRTSRTKNIDGPGGVARQMHLSRNGVYFRLMAVKLDPDDFKAEGAGMAALIQKSSLRRSAKKILED
jgi:hypothetical protein